MRLASRSPCRPIAFRKLTTLFSPSTSGRPTWVPRSRSYCMSAAGRIVSLGVSIAFVIGTSGCCCLCEMQDCRMRAAQLCQQNQMLASANYQAAMNSQQMERALAAANQRLDNLTAERGQLQNRYIALLDRQR